mgnify:CR=1 FL=1
MIIEPQVGMLVNFGSLLIEGERKGVITEILENVDKRICKVRVNFLSEDKENQQTHEVDNCLFMQGEPELEWISASHYQYCYPMLLLGFPIIENKNLPRCEGKIILKPLF